MSGRIFVRLLPLEFFRLFFVFFSPSVFDDSAFLDPASEASPSSCACLSTEFFTRKPVCFTCDSPPGLLPASAFSAFRASFALTKVTIACPNPFSCSPLPSRSRDHHARNNVRIFPQEMIPEYRQQRGPRHLPRSPPCFLASLLLSVSQSVRLTIIQLIESVSPSVRRTSNVERRTSNVERRTSNVLSLDTLPRVAPFLLGFVWRCGSRIPPQ